MGIWDSFKRATRGPAPVLHVQVILEHGADEVETSPNGWTAHATDEGSGVIFSAMVELTGDGHVELTREPIV